jgi:hypothetical protein
VASDGPIRFVLMPRCFELRARRPHENGVKEEVNVTGSEQLAGDLSRRRAEHEPLVLGHAPPGHAVPEHRASDIVSIPDAGPDRRRLQMGIEP